MPDTGKAEATSSVFPQALFILHGDDPHFCGGYANVVAERINGILKQEYGLEMYRTTLEGMKQLVKESIEIYNTKLPHLSCGYKTPEWMHNQQGYPIRTYLTKMPCKLQLAGH